MSNIDTAQENLPRDPITDGSGQITRGWRNYLESRGRRLGEIISGVNLNRQSIVDLSTSVTTNLGIETAARIAADAVVAADATSANATLSTTLTAAFQAADASLQTQINNRATISRVDTVESDAASARAIITANLSAETTARTNADTALQTDINTRATNTRVDTVESNAASALASSSASLTAAYQAADTALQADINTRATVTQLATAESNATSANATLSSTLTAAYQAADATLQTDINTRATSAALTSESAARASADSALASSITSLTATVGTNTANVSTNASAISTLNSSSAIYEVIAAASGGNPARIKLKAGVGGADVELDADRVWFGDETRFDTTSETFITEIGGVRSRYGTAFGASGNEVVMWHGPTSVAVGSEARNNGYLAIGTNGSIWHNTGALNWGATAAEAAASNLLRGNTANIIPDPDHRNPDFWNFPAGASGGDADGGWRRSRWIALANGTYDFSSDYFPVELGATYIVRTRIWNNAGAFSGSFWPLIHIPSIAWYSLKHGAAVNPEVADASNAIVAGGDTGELTWVIANPTGVSANANRQWQFRLKGSFTGGPVVMQVEIVRAARIGDSFVLANGQTLPAQNVLVTSEGTASAITGQGVFATGNYYEQSTDPGAVANGSFWFKTTTNELFVRRSAAWGKVATIANQNLTITRTNGFVKTRIGSGTITSDSVSFSSTGGSGTGYTYAHELFATYTTGPSPTISSASGSPITASASGAVPGDEVRGFIQTTATDSAGNKSTLTSPLALFCES